ncbi:MAG: SgcJ/EcaC family oxidoreductase [Phycisphaerales bacterium]
MIIAPASLFVAAVLTQPAPAAGTAAQPSDATDEISRIRFALVEGFNRGDVDAMAKHFDPDIVAVWQDGTVCHGAAEIKAYYQKLMAGPEKLITKSTTSPQVDGRHLYGDTAVSYGRFNDSYELTSGSTIALNSRFTATLVKRDGAWKVAAFHASGNMFNNDAMKLAVKTTALWAGVGAGLGGLVVGAAAGAWLMRRRSGKAG